MRKVTVLAFVAGWCVASPFPLFADEGHFSGHAIHDGPSPGVYAAGVTYTARMVLNTTQVDPWYPWDPAKEYTAVVAATVFAYYGGFLQVVDFANGATVRVYEDVGSAADFANPATFTDGALILSGGSNDMSGQRVDVAGNPWGVYGTIVFTGGSGLADLSSACGFGLTMNDFIDFHFATSPPGYQEAYDAQWLCAEPVSTESASWGSLKALYR
jgi:hypothetical protein